MNQACDHILRITRPLAEVCRQIQDNIIAIADKDKEIAAIKTKNSNLEGILMIPHISYECVSIDYPRTVCAGTGCTTSVSSFKEKKAAVKQFRIDLENRVKQFKGEQKQINEICAKFGFFLKNSTILPYSDAFESYLLVLLIDETRKVALFVGFCFILTISIHSYELL